MSDFEKKIHSYNLFYNYIECIVGQLGKFMRVLTIIFREKKTFG
jgi:hypothetical protein